MTDIKEGKTLLQDNSKEKENKVLQETRQRSKDGVSSLS